MKKNYFKIIFIFVLFFIVEIVKAEQFTIGEYITGEYVKMVGHGTTKKLTIQRITDSNGNFVYCLEPFVLVDEDRTDYVTYKKDLSGYKKLTEEQKRMISLIAYYGYGYGDRMPDRWYAATQMLIWQVVDPESEFYFTDTFGGEKISKHEDCEYFIMRDVRSHDNAPTFIKDYVVNYGDDLIITDYDMNFKRVSDDYNTIYTPATASLSAKDVRSSGSISFEIIKGNYLRDVVIYSSADSQDLIRPGNVMNQIYTINVNVTSGNIKLDIRDSKVELYTSESHFKDTCYELSNESNVLDTVCVNDQEFVYELNTLPYGNYIVRQISAGVGYEKDETIYEIVLDSDSKTLILNNTLIKNKIELNKYYCIKEECFNERDAVFNVYDKDNELVGSITTDDNGYGFIEVGYGSYVVEQVDGLDNYTFVDIYQVDLLNSDDTYHKDLYNYYIEEEVDIFENEVKEDEDNSFENNDGVLNDEIEETDNVEDDTMVIQPSATPNVPEVLENNNDVILELPPKTGTDIAELLKILYNVFMIVICACIIKRGCYNN